MWSHHDVVALVNSHAGRVNDTLHRLSLGKHFGTGGFSFDVHFPGTLCLRSLRTGFQGSQSPDGNSRSVRSISTGRYAFAFLARCSKDGKGT